MSLTFDDVKRAVKEALKESNVGGVDVTPIEPLVMRKDGAVKVPELVAMKREYVASGDKDAIAFSEYIPEYVFAEEFLTVPDMFPEITAEQYTNNSFNTNRARMTGGFLGFADYVGLSSTWEKRWLWSKHEPIDPIPDAASLPGSNGDVPAVGTRDVRALFERLFERYKATGHVPHWKMGGELV